MIRAALTTLALCLATTAVQAQLAVSANDGKLVLNKGVQEVPANPAPDTATIIDLGVLPPRVIATVPVPTSVIGPPMSVAIAPDENIALVTGAQKLGPDGKLAPSNVLSVIDLKTHKVIQTVHAGQGASGVSINPAGTLALVANRSEGTVTVFEIANKTLTWIGAVPFTSAAGPSHVVFTPDGQHALVTRDGDHKISVLEINGTRVTNTGTDMSAGLRPYGIVMRPQGDFAIVANIGTSPGDDATVSFIDVKARRVVNTISVGPTPEGLALSRDGTLLAIIVMNGSNQPPTSPAFHDFGLLKLYRVEGTSLVPITEAHIGHWCQGVVWRAKATALLVQCMADNEIEIFRFDGKLLTRDGQIAATGPAGIRTAD